MVILAGLAKMDYLAFLEYMDSDPEACHDGEVNQEIILEVRNLDVTDDLAFRKEVLQSSICPSYACLVVHRVIQKLAYPVVEHVAV